MLSKKENLIYTIIIFAMLMFPSVGMLFGLSSDNYKAEKRDLASLPQLYKDDGSFNIDLLSEFGDYFADNFALRQNYVTADHIIFSSILGSSVNDEVLIGKDGWLFYHGTLNDYLGESAFTEREVYIITHNLKLIQNYAADTGAEFLFVIAPNKNSLYGNYMPDNYIKSKSNNAEAVLQNLSENGVNTINLYTVFNSQSEELYLKRDTHWNNKGAFLVYNAVTEYLGFENNQNFEWIGKNDYRGDLDEMYFPAYATYEMQYYKNTEDNYTFVNDAEDGMSPFIEAYNPNGIDTLFMFRDSFGESLIPFFAENFEKSFYSRYVPYDIGNAVQYKPDYLIIEKAERNLIDLAIKPAILPAPLTENANNIEAVKTDSTVNLKKDGSYIIISGEIDKKYIDDKSNILINLIDKSGSKSTYQVFFSTNERRLGNEYYAYFNENDILKAEKIEISVNSGNGNYIVAETNIGGIQ